MNGKEGEDNKIVFAKFEPQSSTLLPTPIANVVSLVTRSSSLYLRVGTFIGGLALDGARVTTLTGLELSRAVIEGILSRAGRDVATRSTGELGRAEAEGLLEKSIATLHTTITNISFAASTGFYFSAAALSSATDLSQQLLATLDSILGSTDSSRAIASIITLIRREFQNPATGVEGEKVGVADLLLGICGLALLQRWSHKLTSLESRQGKYEEVVWDVVVLDNGNRVDVIAADTDKNDANNAKRIRRSGSRGSVSFMTTHGDELLETIEREGINQEESEDDMPEINLKQKIMNSLPADASVSITTSITTTKTITVDITGAHPPELPLPPGVEIIEENSRDLDLDGEVSTNMQQLGSVIPKYHVVYRIARNKLRGTTVLAGDSLEDEEASVDDEPKDIITDSLGYAVSPISSPVQNMRPKVPEKPIRPIISQEKIAGSSSKIPRRSVGSVGSEDEGGLTLSRLPPAQNKPGIAANQKRTRKPMSSSSSISGSDSTPPKKLPARPTSSKVKSAPKPPEKKASLRDALRKGSGTSLSSLWNKDHSQSHLIAQSKPAPRPPWGGSNSGITPKIGPSSQLPVPHRGSNFVPAREAPRAPQRGNPNYFSSRDLGQLQDTPRSPSRSSYYSVHEHRRDSLVSQTDTYSIHSADTRPGSPTTFRTHSRAQSNLLRAKSEKTVSKQEASPSKNHRRVQSYVPSIYTLKTNNSDTSLVVSPHLGRSAFDDPETLDSLMRTGFVNGLFPQHHIVRNMTRFVRFASASYGASFLRVMGIATSTEGTKEIDTFHHHEHHSFSQHTQLPPDSILLSSFVDPQGGTDCTGHTNTGVPMVHFVSLDHASKAVVLTCRGTLGFEDVLTDMTCDYDELIWRGNAYKVHMGIHASARRLLEGGGGRVMATIKAALEEFPEYGLVMCGHSLGGAVTTLLAIMISEPSSAGSAFVTSSEYHRSPLLLTSGDVGTAPPNITLPTGRPIHVYAYGPPATVSPSLRLATRGLITTIVNGQDLVPHLSLGILHDLQAVALAFKTDDTGAKGEVRKRVWAGMTSSFSEKWYGGLGKESKEEDDQWAYSALKVLRASMLSAKLLPPGEVFMVEAMPVLKQNTFMREDGDQGLGRPATRSVLKYVRNVEKRFGEINFGGSMLLDHSPGRYEASLGALGKGVLDE